MIEGLCLNVHRKNKAITLEELNMNKFPSRMDTPSKVTKPGKRGFSNGTTDRCFPKPQWELPQFKK